MPEHIKTYRVFVSSPSDVQAEQKAIKEVIEQINNTRPAGCNVKLEAWGWEDHIASRIGPAPQEVVNQQLPKYDIYVGILSGHFGTPTDKAGSGTEDEFLAALESYKANESLWISFFFDETPKAPKGPKATEQYLKVQQFKESIQEQTLGLYGTYSSTSNGQDSFRAKIDRHLRQIFNQLEQTAATSAATTAASAATADLSAKERIKPPAPSIPPAYLTWLKKECGGVDLLGAKLQEGRSIAITQVYVPLITTRLAEELDDQSSPRKNQRPESLERDQAPQLLLERFDRQSLYVSGAPGSGKTTFARWIAWLCCEGSMPTDRIQGEKGYQESFPSSLRGRLPLLIRLRDFHDHLPRTPGGRDLPRLKFEQCLGAWLNERQPGGLTWQHVEHFLQSGQALVIFDGVDEVPLEHGDSRQPSYPRAMLLSGLAAALSEWEKLGNRVLVTSRPYGLTDSDQKQLGIPHAPIERLDDELQKLLVRKWYGLLLGSQTEGDEVADQFRSNVEQRMDIQELLDNPLLLTAMCIVFNEGKRLPQDRHELYVRIVENVMYHRFPTPPKREMHRNELCVIAYAMHTGEGLNEERTTPQAEATVQEVDTCLRSYQQKSSFTQEGFLDPKTARECLLSESGLLLPRDQGRASFYHLSIQEHLAAQRFLDHHESDLVSAYIERSVVKEWRHTLSFVFGAYAARYRDPGKSVQFVEKLLEQMRPTDLRLQVAIADCLEVLRGRGVQLRDASLNRFREACISAIAREVEIADRHILGQALGWVGDPRVEPDLRNPVSRELAFVLIKPGDYAYQDGRVQFAEPFYLSRYPVTNQQYEMFVDDQGYSTRSHWSDEGWKWKKESNISEPRFWHHPRWNCPNKPVVGVSWYEAEAFCRWAGGQLPSEEQWEGAARGGDGREYPWGNKWRDGICNSIEARLNETSSVGLFPSSRTPEDGLEDMAGNVWEWCADWYYEGSFRVDRGGGWRGGAADCRSAYRDWGVPSYRGSLLGFRLALSPLEPPAPRSG